MCKRIQHNNNNILPACVQKKAAIQQVPHRHKPVTMATAIILLGNPEPHLSNPAMVMAIACRLGNNRLATAALPVTVTQDLIQSKFQSVTAARVTVDLKVMVMEDPRPKTEMVSVTEDRKTTATVADLSRESHRVSQSAGENRTTVIT